MWVISSPPFTYAHRPFHLSNIFDEFFNKTTTTKLMLLNIFQQMRCAPNNQINKHSFQLFHCLKFSPVPIRCIIVLPTSHYPFRLCSPFYSLFSVSFFLVSLSVYICHFSRSLNVLQYIFYFYMSGFEAVSTIYMNLHSLWIRFKYYY